MLANIAGRVGDEMGKQNPLAKERREAGGFTAIPHVLLRSPVFTSLSAHAVKLLMDLAAQYSGFNNGDFTMAWAVMEKRGWRSRETLNSARKQLLQAGLIEMTRIGDRRRPHLYGFTFFALDDCGGKVKATARPSGLWRLNLPLPPILKKTIQGHARRVITPNYSPPVVGGSQPKAEL